MSTTRQGLRTTALDWTSSDPHLSGNFAPIGPEIDAANLRVVAGRIPDDLRGTYLRNGPNPEFSPISYTYPMDGDGMVHAVTFSQNGASYRNRFVQTRGLGVERRAKRSVYGGLLRPVPVDASLVGTDGEEGPFKSGAFVSVIDHGGTLVALGEAQPAYEITPDLETVGEWRAGSDHVVRLGAHNRRHPRSGDLFAICYSVREPVVHVHRIAPNGVLAQTFDVALTKPSMIHDFVLTEHWLVLVVGPAVFDPDAPAHGKPFLQYRPELGTRIGCIPLDGGEPRWIEIDDFFVYHFANGFERGSEIVIDYVRHARLSLGPHAPAESTSLHRLVVDPIAKKAENKTIADFLTEFPRVDDARSSLPTRFAYLAARSKTFEASNPTSASYDSVAKVDVESGAVVRHDFDGRIIGEATFVPRASQRAEDDGYLVTFSYDAARGVSEFVVLDAAHVDAEPVAVLALPQRVPQGLHGIWIPKK